MLKFPIINFVYNYFLNRIIVKCVSTTQEYGWESAQTLATLYNGVVADIVDLLTKTSKSLHDTLDKYKGIDLSQIINDMKTSIRTLPDRVINLPHAARDIRETMAKYKLVNTLFHI